MNEDQNSSVIEIICKGFLVFLCMVLFPVIFLAQVHNISVSLHKISMSLEATASTVPAKPHMPDTSYIIDTTKTNPFFLYGSPSGMVVPYNVKDTMPLDKVPVKKKKR